MNRRNFLAKGTAAAAGALGLLGGPDWLGAAEPKSKTRIRVVYSLHGAQQAGPDWPNKGFDFTGSMRRIHSELQKRCSGFEFLTSLATGEAQAKEILEQDKAAGIDGYVVYQMNCWNRVVQTIATSNKPVLYADFQFGGSGGFLVYTAGFLRSKTPNVGFAASSRMEDVAAAVKCFEVVKKGGSVAEFVAATAQARLARTPKAGRLACKHDDLKTLPIQDCVRRARFIRFKRR